MKTLRNLVLTSALVTLGGCTVFSSFSDVDALNKVQAQGSPFTQALTAEYRAFANSELKDMFDYPDALHFARKGLAAAAGESVTPEPVGDWNLNAKHARELAGARARLVTALDQGARESNPALAAKAQARFDCWIEQQEENWQDADIDACRNDFNQAMTGLEGGMKAPEAPRLVTPSNEFGVDANAPMAPEDAMYLVFFNWDSAELGTGALNVLDAIAAEVSKNPPAGLNVIGHADTSGPDRYNQRLALKRANAVRDALVSRGVDASMIMVDARGEKELLVPTPDNVREPANRRVNVSFY